MFPWFCLFLGVIRLNHSFYLFKLSLQIIDLYVVFAVTTALIQVKANALFFYMVNLFKFVLKCILFLLRLWSLCFASLSLFDYWNKPSDVYTNMYFTSCAFDWCSILCVDHSWNLCNVRCIPNDVSPWNLLLGIKLWYCINFFTVWLLA